MCVLAGGGSLEPREAQAVPSSLQGGQAGALVSAPHILLWPGPVAAPMGQGNG